MNTSERLQALIKHLGVNAKNFSELCGYDRPQVIYDIIRGKTRNFSAAMCDRILAVVPDLSRSWLLTGEGSMLKCESDDTERTLSSVPVLPLAAIAGPLKTYFEPGVDNSGCQFIPSPYPNADYAMPVTGDSMEPVFPDGSQIFVKRINEEAFIPWGHTMVIDTENGVFIKNVMPDDDDQSYIWAESINPKYPRMHIPKYSILGLYRVLGVQKSFMTM